MSRLIRLGSPARWLTSSASVVEPTSVPADSGQVGLQRVVQAHFAALGSVREQEPVERLRDRAELVPAVRAHLTEAGPGRVAVADPGDADRFDVPGTGEGRGRVAGQGRVAGGGAQPGGAGAEHQEGNSTHNDPDQQAQPRV